MFGSSIHQIHDLQPYQCTYEDCPDPHRLYGQRQEWIDHENQHRRVWHCHAHSKEFETQPEYIRHANDEHSGEGSSPELTATLVGSSLQPHRDCPFCPTAFSDLAHLRKHITYHLERLALFALPDIEIDVKDQDVSERSSDTNLAVERRGRRDSIKGDFSQEETVAFAEILDSKTGKLENLGVPPDTRNITLALEATKHKEQGHLDIWQWLSHAQAYEIEDDESELTKDNKWDRTSVRLDEDKCYSPQEALNHSQPIKSKTPAQLASNMTLIYKDQSRLKEAEDIAVQAMEKCTTVLGTNHPDTLMSMANLASIYQDQNRWQEAEEL